MTFLDLQLRWRGIRKGTSLMTTFDWVLTWGHCRQPRPLQRWSSEGLFGKLNFLFWTTLFPIELFFFNAKIMRVSPINSWNSVLRLCTSALKFETPSKKCTGNTRVSPSTVSVVADANLSIAFPFRTFNFVVVYPLASKCVMHCLSSSSLSSVFELFLKVLKSWEKGMELKTEFGWKLFGFK